MTQMFKDEAGYPARYLLEHAACPWEVVLRLVRAHCGPLSDDFEIARGWRVDAAGTDTATSGPETALYELLGDATDVDAAWTSRRATCTVPASGAYRLRVEATDGGADGLVEAGVDDIWIAAITDAATLSAAAATLSAAAARPGAL